VSWRTTTLRRDVRLLRVLERATRPPRGHHRCDAGNPRSRLRAPRRAFVTSRQPGNRRDLVILALPAQTAEVFVDRHLRRMPTPARESVESDITDRPCSATPNSPHRLRRPFNVLVQRHDLEGPGRARKVGWTRAFVWSGRRDSNPRPSPWQGDAIRAWRPLSPVEQALLR
jgi:hypothetical protein